MKKIKNIYQNIAYSLNFKRAQNTHNLTKAKRFLELNLKILHNQSDKINNKIKKSQLNLALEINKQQIMHRVKEHYKIIEEIEKLYNNSDFKTANIVLNFLKAEIKNSGFESTKKKFEIYKKKIDQNINLLNQLDKYKNDLLSQLPPLVIQFRYYKMFKLLIECKKLDKNDPVHKEIIIKVQNDYNKFAVYIKKYGISENHTFSEEYTYFYIIKKSFQLRLSELKLKYFVYFAKKSQSLLKSKKKLLKVQNLIQKKPDYFSLENKELINNLLSEIVEKQEKTIRKTEKILKSSYKLMLLLKFKEAEYELNNLSDKLKESSDISLQKKIENQLKICHINQDYGQDIINIEKIFAQQDKLGAKTAIMELKEKIKADNDKDQLLPVISKKIVSFENRLSQKNIKTKSFKEKKVSQFGLNEKNDDSDTDLFHKFRNLLISKKEIEKIKMANLLNINEDDLFEKLVIWKQFISFKLEDGLIILNSAKLKSKIDSKNNETEILEDLDAVLNLAP